MPLGVYPVANREEMRSVFNDHQRKEQARIKMDPLPIAQEDASIASSVYIYNVGPWTHLRDLASMGKKLIGAVPQEKVFDGLCVSQPLVIPGQPWEGYPMEKPIRLFSGRPAPADRSMIPDGIEGKRIKNPGFDLAMEIIGYGMGQNDSNKIDRFGVFISEFQEPKGRPSKPQRPKGDASTEEFVTFGKAMGEYNEYDAKFKEWEAMVRSAQEKLRGYCALEVQRADDSWKQGTFLADYPEARRKRAHACAELIKADAKMHGWLGDAHSNIKPKACIACFELMDAKALKCKCGQLQVTQEVFDTEMKLRMEANAA